MTRSDNAQPAPPASSPHTSSPGPLEEVLAEERERLEQRRQELAAGDKSAKGALLPYADDLAARIKVLDRASAALQRRTHAPGGAPRTS